MNNLLEMLQAGNSAAFGDEFGQANQESFEQLQKALSAGSGADAGSFVGGRALIVESLDQTLVNILHTQQDAVLFQALKKQPVKSPVHQWDERTAVGADDGAWVAEGGDSEEHDQTIARKYITMKYLQTLRKVTLQMTISNSIEDATALEENAGTLWLIRNIETQLFEGDSSLIAEQPDGLKKLIPSSNVLDMRGKDASSSDMQDKIEEACRMIRDNFGRGSLMLGSTMVMQDIQRILRDRIRFDAGQTQGGSIFESYPTPFGKPTIKDDIFVREGGIPVASTLTTKRPSAPTMTSSKAPNGSSQFAAADAGDYVYKVVAVNKYGRSVASAEEIVTAVAAGESVTLAVTKGADPAPTAYEVYRSKKGGATGAVVRYALTVAYTASPMNVIDHNAELPGTSSLYVLTMESMYDAVEWAQFLPMMKFQLYPTAAAVYPFLMLLFGALALKKPAQHVRVKNISPSTLGWF